MDSDIEEALKGKAIYGDVFTLEEVEKWYAEEQGAYGELNNGYEDYHYKYHELNKYHGFSKLKIKNSVVLSFGGGIGEELQPIKSAIEQLIMVDYVDKKLLEKIDPKVVVIQPNIDGGVRELSNCSIDMITCFGVLHHIPNVTEVLMELNRVLKSGGVMLLREPIVSMGDWTKKRSGLTPMERGIPDLLFDEAIEKAGFMVQEKRYCCFAPLSLVARKLKVDMFNSGLLVRMDSVFARVFRFNYSYHALKWYEKVRPTSTFYILRK